MVSLLSELVHQLGARRLDCHVVCLEPDLSGRDRYTKSGQEIQPAVGALDDSVGTKEFADELLEAQV